MGPANIYIFFRKVSIYTPRILLARREGHAHHYGGNPGRVTFALVEIFQELIVEDAKGVGHAIGCR